MSVREVVRHDLLVLQKSKLSWGGLLALLLPTAVAFAWSASGTTSGGTPKGIFAAMFAIVILVPIIIFVTTASAIARERESGTIRFLLGNPNDRSEVILGKMLSRALLVNGGLLVGSLGIALSALVLTDAPRLATIGVFAFLTMLFATSYVGLVVGISAVSANQMRSFVGIAAAYLFWSVGWLPGFPYSVSMFVVEKVEALLGRSLEPSSVVLVEVVNPPTAYMQSLQLLGPTFENVARGSSTANTLAPPPAVVGVLVAWTVVPLALGCLAFSRAEID